jgi:hypothetical protein
MLVTSQLTFGPKLFHETVQDVPFSGLDHELSGVCGKKM